jgi:purine-nucleoside phosphorylase
MELPGKTAAAIAAIRGRWPARPRVGLVLGTGLGCLAETVRVDCALDYADIPHFPRVTAPGHRGSLLCGTLDNVPVVAMSGRFHRYEGHPSSTVTRPVRTMIGLGVEAVILSNASGGLNPALSTGDVFVIDDHIDLMGKPAVPAGRGQSGGPQSGCPPGRGTPSRVYDPILVDQALRSARRHDFACYRGVYVGVPGPNYETRAEYRYLRRIGGDIVGMSTVSEAIVAARAAVRVLALSVVTNDCRSHGDPTDGQAVVAAAAAAGTRMRAIVIDVVRSFSAHHVRQEDHASVP